MGAIASAMHAELASSHTARVQKDQEHARLRGIGGSGFAVPTQVAQHITGLPNNLEPLRLYRRRRGLSPVAGYRAEISAAHSEHDYRSVPSKLSRWDHHQTLDTVRERFGLSGRKVPLPYIDPGLRPVRPSSQERCSTATSAARAQQQNVTKLAVQIALRDLAGSRNATWYLKPLQGAIAT